MYIIYIYIYIHIYIYIYMYIYKNYESWQENQQANDKITAKGFER